MGQNNSKHDNFSSLADVSLAPTKHTRCQIWGVEMTEAFHHLPNQQFRALILAEITRDFPSLDGVLGDVPHT